MFVPHAVHFLCTQNIAFDYWSSGEFSIENKYVNHSIKSNIPRFAWSNVLTVVIKRVTTHRCVPLPTSIAKHNTILSSTTKQTQQVCKITAHLQNEDCFGEPTVSVAKYAHNNSTNRRKIRNFFRSLKWTMI